MRIESRLARYAPHMEPRECVFLDGELMRTANRRVLSWSMVLLLKPLVHGQHVTRSALLEASGLWLRHLHVFETRLLRLRKELSRYGLAVAYHPGRGYRLETVPENIPRAA